MDFGIFLQLVQKLSAKDVAYVVVGGVAMNVQGIARATRDIDLFVKADTGNIARLKLALHAMWNDPEIDAISVDDLMGDYPAVQYGPPDEDLSLDILTRLGEAFDYDNIEAETITVEGIPVRVATPRMLYRMKSVTRRPIDQADVAALVDKFRLEPE